MAVGLGGHRGLGQASPAMIQFALELFFFCYRIARGQRNEASK